MNTTTGGDSLHSGPSSAVSPGVAVGVGGGSGGPPLKLRFAVEAGHYTLMENQESSLDQSNASTVPATTIIDVTPKQQQAEEGAIITKVEEPLHTSSKETNFKSESVEPVSGLLQVSLNSFSESSQLLFKLYSVFLVGNCKVVSNEKLRG